MLRALTRAISAAALLAAAATPVLAEEFCSIPPQNLINAATQHADMAFALNEVTKHAIATWYTDRESVESSAAKLKTLTSTCAESSRLLLVVYGLPEKDCTGGYSSGGNNKNAADYKQFIQTLADAVGTRKALYVLEPDAVGALGNGGCGVGKGYAANLKVALQILSKNANADIYLDVGYWKLSDASQAAQIAAVVKELVQSGKIKGIALNTSNYRSNKEISTLCGNFQKAYGDDSLHCITDTSRNYQEPTSTDWCNTAFGAIGSPPSAQTEFPNLDYYIWIKPAGESDGNCNGGPNAGAFFQDGFKQLWNNGYFVKKMGYPAIDGKAHTIAQSTTTAPTSASQSTSTAASTTTPTPTTTATVTQATNSMATSSRTADSEATAATTSTATTTAPAVAAATTPAPRKKCRAKVQARTTTSLSVKESAVVEVTTTPPPKVISFAAATAVVSTTEDQEQVSTKTTASTSSGISAGLVAAVVIGCVAVLAVAVVSIRRLRSQDLESDVVPTPSDISLHHGINVI